MMVRKSNDGEKLILEVFFLIFPRIYVFFFLFMYLFIRLCSDQMQLILVK